MKAITYLTGKQHRKRLTSNQLNIIDSLFSIRTFSSIQKKDPQGPPPQNVKTVKINEKNQLKSAYKPDPKISLIIKSSPNDILNSTEKERFNKVLKECAMGLFKYYKRETNKSIIKNTDEFVMSISKALDGKTFTLFIKYLDELRQDVLENESHKLTPDSFLIFLDKIKNLTHSETLNDLILRKMSSIDINLINTKDLLNVYQKNSIDFKFEENLRMDEIRQFANEVIPKPRFIFDRYQTSLTNPKASDSQSSQEEGFELEAQKSNPNDEYFSFFSSHEKMILKPESNFKNLRQFMQFLPIDYYILLQKNFETDVKFDKTNYVLFRNLPILNKRKNASGLKVVKPITHIDIINTNSREEASKILTDEQASEELICHLEKKFGQVENFFFINFKPERVLEMYNKTKLSVGFDELDEFETKMKKKMTKKNKQTNESQESPLQSSLMTQDSDINSDNPLFEDLIQLASEEFLKAEEVEQIQEQKANARKGKKGSKTKNAELNEEQQQQAIEQVKQKERQMLGLDNQINRNGLIKFKSYEEKLKMMSHPMFIFGMKLYNQQQSLEFFDADFCNTITVECPAFEGLNLGQVCQMINEYLIKQGFERDLLKVGKLNGIGDDFDLNNIIVKQDFKISLRFNTFSDALEAIRHLSNVNEQKKQVKFITTFHQPHPNYYDGKLSTNFESCIKDKFEGLHKINEVDANYVKLSQEQIKQAQEQAEEINDEEDFAQSMYDSKNI